MTLILLPLLEFFIPVVEVLSNNPSVYNAVLAGLAPANLNTIMTLAQRVSVSRGEPYNVIAVGLPLAGASPATTYFLLDSQLITLLYLQGLPLQTSIQL